MRSCAPAFWLIGLVGWLLLGSMSMGRAHAQYAALLLTVTPAFEGNYAPGAWLSLEVTLQNDGPAFEALLAATPVSPGATRAEPPVRYTRTVQVPAEGQLEASLYVAMEQRSDEVLVTVEDAAGMLAEQRVPVVPHADIPLIGVVADRALVLDVPGQPVSLTARDLPDQAPVLRNFAVLVVADVPAAGLNSAQQHALASWIWHGGHLVLGSEAAIAQTLPDVPALWHPATPGDAVTLDMLSLMDVSDPAADPPPALSGVLLNPAPGTTRVGAPDAPLWVQRSLGAGGITQLAFDPAARALVSWDGASDLWKQLLRSEVALRSTFGIERTVAHAQEKHATAVVGNLPPTNLPPIRVLWLVLLLYPLVLVPGVLLLLRRYDRLVWAWLALPGMGVLLAALIAGLAWALRSDGRAVSQITLIEQIYGDVVHMRSFVGLLAPQDDTFWLDIPEEARVRPLRSRDTLFPTSAVAQVMGVRGDVPQQGGTFPVTVTDGQLQGMTLEQTTVLAGPEAEIAVDDTGMVVHVHNPTALHVHDVVVAYGEQLVFVGDLAAGQQRTVAWPYAADGLPIPPASGTSLGLLLFDSERDGALSHLTEREQSRREVLMTAAVQRGTVLADPGPWLLAWLEEPPAQAALSIRPAGPAMQQTTLFVGRPALSGSGHIRLPPGWLRTDVAGSGQVVCFDGALPGVPSRNPPVVISMRLPAELAALRATMLRLELDSERRWPTTGVVSELYNWQQMRWDAFAYDGPGVVDIPNPAPYVQNGELRLRLGGSIDEARCVVAQAMIGGQIP
jgi:hypothetical protein